MPIKRRHSPTLSQLPVTSSDFPTGFLASKYHNKADFVHVTKAKLIWAAITVGKPKPSHLFQHGVYSFYEILNRCSLVQMNVDFSCPCGRLRLSPAFHTLDPTEKGMVSYNLGMMVTKLCAHQLLDTPILVHLDWMEKAGKITTLTPSRSRADLLGKSRKTKKWSLFEAKGRSGKFSQKILDGAKTQAQMNIRIDGQPRELGVACALFAKDHFDFHWSDPVSDEDEPRELKTTRQTWNAYYGNAMALFDFQNNFPEAAKRMLGFTISVDPRALKFARALDDLNSERWREIEPTLGFDRDEQVSPGDRGAFSGLDGLTIHLTEEMIE